MKKLIVIVTSCILSLNTMGQDYRNDKVQMQDTVVKYCAKQKGSKIIMVQGEKDLVADVKLENGTTIKTNGMVIKMDGEQILVKNGECVDYKGNLITLVNQNKMTNKEFKMSPK